MTLDDWLRGHPYLDGVAREHARVAAAVDAVAVPALPLPDWDSYREDFEAGIPLLASGNAAIDLEPAAMAIPQVIDVLRNQRGGAPDESVERYVTWLVSSKALQPLVRAFADWRDEDRWMRRYCPACGSLPAMAQLTGNDPGRKRFLCCGCCRSRWRYARTGCPFCETESHSLASVGIEGEGGLRIDYCASCRAYLKTYDGQGAEQVLLADWTSLHLDVVARDRGLQRLAASLYELNS